MITIPTPVDPAFSPPTTTANEDVLNTQAEAFVSNLGRIIGQRGTEVSTQMTTTAVDFSQLVAEPLRTNGATFLAAAEAASEGAAHGSEVTAQLATAVTTFKQEISRLVNEWNAAAPLFGASPPTPENVAAAKQALLGVLNPQATAAHEALLTAADTANGMLTSGPTPTNLQALAAGAGGGSWLMFNLFGAQAGTPNVGANEGRALADQILDNVAKGLPLTPQMFDVLRSIGLDAQGLQGTGAHLAPGHIEYLRELFGGLDKPWAENWPIQTEALYLLPDVIRDAGLSGADQSMMLGAMGGGLLALSNRNLGGGTSMLPESLQRVIGNYFPGVSGSPVPPGLQRVSDPMQQMNGLGAMLGATSHKGVDLAQLEGGNELSAALTFAVADANSPEDLVAQDSPPELRELRFMDERARVDLLGASTRNTEVNAALLNGQTLHPVYGSDTPEYVIRGVFGHDYVDDGEAATGLINWITDPNLPGHLEDEATRAAYNVFTLSTNHFDSTQVDPVTQQPGRWDTSTYDLLTDGFGQIDQFQSAPVGKANPAIAMAMSELAIDHVDYFNDADVGNEAGARPNELTLSGDPRDDDMYLTLDTRQDFVELVMGDPHAANAFGVAAYGVVLGEAGGMDDWGIDPVTGELDIVRGNALAGENALRGGNLLGLFDTGFQRVQEDATGDAGAVSDRNAQHGAMSRAAAAILKEAVLEIPGVKAVKGVGQVLIREMFELGKWSPGVAERYGGAFSPVEPGEVPAPYRSSEEYAKYKFQVAHRVVEQMIHDGKLHIEDVRDRADSRLFDQKGDLRTADALLGAHEQPSDPEHPTGNLTYIQALTELESLFSPELQDKFQRYNSDFDIQREDR